MTTITAESLSELKREDPAAWAAIVLARMRTSGLRVWTSGFVYTEPLELGQIQPFVSWPKSDLRYQIGPEGEPPPGYTGVTYAPTRSDYPPSPYIDYFD